MVEFIFIGLVGAGAIRSSTKDMMIYLKSNMKDYKNSVFQEAKYTFLLSEKRKVNLGWIVVDMPGKIGESIIAHDGATSGFRSYLGFVESEDIGVIILANGTRSVISLGKNILQIFAKESKKSASVASELYHHAISVPFYTSLNLDEAIQIQESFQILRNNVDRN